MIIKENYSLLKYNTFGFDVKTKYFVEYENEKDLEKLLHDEYFFSQQFWHIGEGSNLLFLGNYDGVIVHSGIKGMKVVEEDEDHVWVKVGAGEHWDDFVAYCVERGWQGAENLSYIPGEAGASAVQNIGAYGAEVKDIIETVDAYSLETGEKKIFSNRECEYAYRLSFFKKEQNHGKYYITHVTYRLNKKASFNLEYGNLRKNLEGKEVNLLNIRNTVVEIRKNKLPDPKVYGNAGSFFKNPYITKEKYEKLKEQYPDMPSYPVSDKSVKVPAAWMIEKCGLKGKNFGGAYIHEKQALVIINKEHAVGTDVAMLAEFVRSSVKEKFGVEINPEVNYI